MNNPLSKRLILLRHAETIDYNSQGDFFRELTPKGQSDATALGAHMRNRNLHPDLILCSSATRTQQTGKNLMTSADITQERLEIKSDLRNADIEDLLDLLKETENTVQTLLLIGHNPVIHMLAGQLGMNGDDELYAKISGNYPPATLCDIGFKGKKWAELSPEKCQLVHVALASEYNPPEASHQSKPMPV